MQYSILFYIGSLLISIITACWIYKWFYPKCDGILPPGSMGLPLLGETLQFLSSSTSFDIHPFVKKRMQRYGSVFKTNLVGSRIIVSADGDLNNYIFKQEGDLFRSWYPASFTEVFGRQNIGTLHGFMYKYLKNMVMNLLGPEGLRKMLPDVENVSRNNLERWARNGTIEARESIAKMIFELTAKKLISCDSEERREDLRENFSAFIKGLISFPANIPGTAYNKCMKGRKNVVAMLKDMLRERRQNPRNEKVDFFDYVLEELQQEGSILTEEIALDLMVTLLFASFETTSLALTIAIKFLVDHPPVLKELIEEHKAIIRRRDTSDSYITWDEYKSMKFTFQVINETVRLANIAPGIFRKATKDIKFNEYTIPSGWGVMVCLPAVHLNHDIYENPLKFNPWRWEGIDTNVGSRNFMAFGGGMRLCVGAEFAKMQMAVFLHCLVTKYKWKSIEGGDIVRNPGLQYPHGYYIKIDRKSETMSYTRQR
ncbi:cytochrome P450 87A3-like [Andrographis paniculata]|uniref:cytochrome P450 87A3-like n=1 Tax=Andrographis paniculata TaxID=175694 RepID=UPI0021E99C4C|nr:cytochrome P450 87A3-like [Andrographis paniculata]